MVSFAARNWYPDSDLSTIHLIEPIDMSRSDRTFWDRVTSFLSCCRLLFWVRRMTVQERIEFILLLPMFHQVSG